MNDAFLQRCDPGPGDGVRLAVKDLIDVAGMITTGGCRGVAEVATPAAADAPCVARMRACGARVVGKTALNELAAGADGANAWYGTPVNPLDRRLVPGGSSSGSAVAVATGEADVALGTDTGGSVRVPAACCGVAGLKTTFGRLPVEGVLALAPSLDTVGVLAPDVGGLARALAMLEPGLRVPQATPGRVARLRGLAEAPAVTVAVDAALDAAGLVGVDVELEGWRAAADACRQVILAEAAEVHAALLRERPDGVSAPVRAAFAAGAALTGAERVELARRRARWVAEVTGLLDTHGVLVLPTLLRGVPPLGPPVTPGSPLVAATAPVNLAGLPALSLPVGGPAGVSPASRVPVSVQLVGPAGTEGALLALGALLEVAAGGGGGGRPARR